MSKNRTSNRTKPNKSNRAAILALNEKSILRSELIGLRSIVEAEQEIIRPIGLDTFNEQRYTFTPRCIKLLYAAYNIKFNHKSSKSIMDAVIKHASHSSCMIDPSATLPRNRFAENLLDQGRIQGETLYGYENPKIYGDAVIVEDVRRHWYVHPRKSLNIDLAQLHDDLTTPHRLRGYANGVIHSILFEEEPNSDDILLLSMKYL